MLDSNDGIPCSITAGLTLSANGSFGGRTHNTRAWELSHECNSLTRSASCSSVKLDLESFVPRLTSMTEGL